MRRETVTGRFVDDVLEFQRFPFETRERRRLPLFRRPTRGFCRELGRFMDLSGLEERIMNRIDE